MLSAPLGSLRLVITETATVRGPRQSERLGTDGAAGYGAERLGSRSLIACAMKACAVTKQDGQVVGSTFHSLHSRQLWPGSAGLLGTHSCSPVSDGWLAWWSLVPAATGLSSVHGDFCCKLGHSGVHWQWDTRTDRTVERLTCHALFARVTIWSLPIGLHTGRCACRLLRHTRVSAVRRVNRWSRRCCPNFRTSC